MEFPTKQNREILAANREASLSNRDRPSPINECPQPLGRVALLDVEGMAKAAAALFFFQLLISGSAATKFPVIAMFGVDLCHSAPNRKISVE